MKIIGLAGESGTGKSTIAAYLTTRGGAHVDADIVGHEILENDPEVREAIRERVSADVFARDGRLDRRRLGQLVFDDADMLQTLNDILHPAIRRECGARVQALEARGVPFVVIDAALLLTSQMPFEFDLLIALDCGRDEQLRRLSARGVRTREEVSARLRNQRHIRDFFDNADVVVNTDKPKQEVFAEIDSYVDQLLGSETV